jgi:MFS superfamily sulfate permease-like transporter
LASALVISAGYSPSRLFLLWGIVYVLSGLYFRVPVSVQPLKAMAVIAIATGLSLSQLGSAAVGYGVLMLLLALTGTLQRIREWFSPALVRGIQLGIGLILLQKAWGLVWGGPWILGHTTEAGVAGPLTSLGAIAVLQLSRFTRGWNLAVPIFLAGAVLGVAVMGWPQLGASEEPLLAWSLPDWASWPSLFVVLMLPQLPLTLGNAVIAAADACHHYWPDRAQRVGVRRLAVSIGTSNVLIGLLGGFPVCHGAGGIAAHARFGGRTGRTTILVGSALILAGLFPLASALLLCVPVPVLAALLALVGVEMLRLLRTLEHRSAAVVAIGVGATSFITHNLAWGLLIGWALERLLPVAIGRPRPIWAQPARELGRSRHSERP